MAEAVFRIPSKAVQYGYVEFTQEMGGLDPENVAYAYVNYVYAFQKAEQDAVKAIQEGLSAPQGASRGVTEEQAQRYLDEGLGGVTAVSDPDEAPWDKPAAEVKKPWETGDTTLAVSADW